MGRGQNCDLSGAWNNFDKMSFLTLLMTHENVNVNLNSAMTQVDPTHDLLENLW